MLSRMANSEEDPNLGNNKKKGNKKGTVNLEELSYDVMMTGGLRTLEKDTHNIDIVRFDMEAEIDPLFR
jgi:hypothetical protein